MAIAYVLITCDLGVEASLIKALQTIPEVKEVRGVLGVFDIFVKLESDKVDRLLSVVAEIRSIGKVRNTNTLMAVLEQGGK